MLELTFGVDVRIVLWLLHVYSRRFDRVADAKHGELLLLLILKLLVVADDLGVVFVGAIVLLLPLTGLLRLCRDVGRRCGVAHDGHLLLELLHLRLVLLIWHVLHVLQHHALVIHLLLLLALAGAIIAAAGDLLLLILVHELLQVLVEEHVLLLDRGLLLGHLVVVLILAVAGLLLLLRLALHLRLAHELLLLLVHHLILRH